MRRKQKPPTTPTEYPAGTFLKTEKGYFYIVNSSKRYRLISWRAVESWKPHRVVETTEAALKNYRVAAKMKFRNGSLIHNLADGTIYLIVDGKRCQMVSPEAFERLGTHHRSKDIVTVSPAEINLHALGEEIS